MAVPWECRPRSDEPERAALMTATCYVTVATEGCDNLQLHSVDGRLGSLEARDARTAHFYISSDGVRNSLNMGWATGHRNGLWYRVSATTTDAANGGGNYIRSLAFLRFAVLWRRYSKLGYAGNSAPSFTIPTAIAAADDGKGAREICDLDFVVGDEASILRFCADQRIFYTPRIATSNADMVTLPSPFVVTISSPRVVRCKCRRRDTRCTP